MEAESTRNLLEQQIASFREEVGSGVPQPAASPRPPASGVGFGGARKHARSHTHTNTPGSSPPTVLSFHDLDLAKIGVSRHPLTFLTMGWQ